MKVIVEDINQQKLAMLCAVIIFIKVLFDGMSLYASRVSYWVFWSNLDSKNVLSRISAKAGRYSFHEILGVLLSQRPSFFFLIAEKRELLDFETAQSWLNTCFKFYKTSWCDSTYYEDSEYKHQIREITNWAGRLLICLVLDTLCDHGSSSKSLAKRADSIKFAEKNPSFTLLFSGLVCGSSNIADDCFQICFKKTVRTFHFDTSLIKWHVYLCIWILDSEKRFHKLY